YNGDNQLSGVDWGAANALYFAYDPMNRRIKKLSAATGVWTHSVWEGSQVIKEYENSSGTTRSYYYFGSRLIRKATFTPGGGGHGGGVSTVRTWLSDRLSLRVGLDQNGNVVGRQGHLPYGEEMGTSGEMDKRRFTSGVRQK
ncbi:MAG: hypothetical protein ACREBC_17665, partial [Pyrinomonadaceae bacterium]